MKITVKKLRKIIRESLLNEDPTGASFSDPLDGPKGFYDYEITRGADIHSFWYRSPGRGIGQDGDPGRPEDAKAYIGMFANIPGTHLTQIQADQIRTRLSNGEKAVDLADEFGVSAAHVSQIKHGTSFAPEDVSPADKVFGDEKAQDTTRHKSKTTKTFADLDA